MLALCKKLSLAAAVALSLLAGSSTDAQADKRLVCSMKGTWLESHFSWQIRTFWYALLWLIAAVVLIMTLIGVPVGFGILIALTVWLIYRIARGWLRLLDRKTMYF